ncbi:putative signal transducing protein [Mariniflexile sp. HNIBRBA6329]|uniref:putative signal transducing protein n=1 Tax=Mariniflexile sp. HNIBRBA6329 TaxID=3373088 RepID=UPI00374588D7
MIDIFSGSVEETMIIRNLLESKNIQVFLTNQLMASIEPIAVSSGGFNAVTLKINEEDFEKAKKVLEDYNNGNLSL